MSSKCSTRLTTENAPETRKAGMGEGPRPSEEIPTQNGVRIFTTDRTGWEWMGIKTGGGAPNRVVILPYICLLPTSALQALTDFAGDCACHRRSPGWPCPDSGMVGVGEFMTGGKGEQTPQKSSILRISSASCAFEFRFAQAWSVDDKPSPNPHNASNAAFCCKVVSIRCAIHCKLLPPNVLHTVPSAKQHTQDSK